MMLATNIIAKNTANVNPQETDIFQIRNVEIKNPTILVSINPADKCAYLIITPLKLN
jgi:hypothetical protein